MRTFTKPTVTDSAALSWHRSTYSDGAGGMCVEVAHTGGGVAVRDSRDPDGPVLTFSGAEWDAFLAGARAGEFDLPGSR